jgi:hypothetical protein
LWDAPEFVVKYLKTGDVKLRAAAGDARDAAWAAAWDAAEKKQRTRLKRMVDRAFALRKQP